MIMTIQKRNYQDGIMMIKGYEKELTLIYENIRLEEEKNLEKRRKEIKQKHPDILELDNLIRKNPLIQLCQF